MFELSAACPNLRRHAPLVFVLMCMSVAVVGCSEDDGPQQSLASEDAGEDASQDARIDAVSDADAERDAALDTAVPHDSDVPGDAADTADTDRDAGDAADADFDSSNERDGSGQPQSCADGDGACPSGCYATTDDDCSLDCRDPATWPPSWVAFEDEAIRLVNLERAQGATCGTDYNPPAAAVTFNAQLREAARCHSLDMARNDVYGHEGSNGSTAGERLDDTGYDWRTRTEVVAAKRFTPAAVVAAWMGSPGHCNGLTQSKYHEIGMGYVFEDPDALGYQAYWTGVLATSW